MHTKFFIVLFLLFLIPASLPLTTHVLADDEPKRKEHVFTIDLGSGMSYTMKFECQFDENNKTSLHFEEARMPTIYYNPKLGDVSSVRFDENEKGKVFAHVTFKVADGKKDKSFVAMQIPLEVFYPVDQKYEDKKIMMYYKDDLPWALKFVPK